MKILMVRPRPSKETIGLQHLMVVEPLELEILYALKRPGDDARIIDMILEKRTFLSFLEEYKPDILCVSGYISNVNTMIAYCEQFKSKFPDRMTMVGGVHCEVCPEDFEHPSVDFRVLRNAALIFSGLLDHIEDKNKPLPAGVLKVGQKKDDIILPAFDFSMPVAEREATARYRDKYFYIFHSKVALIKTSFGCPYSCSFCFCRIITEGAYFQRSVEEVIDELETIKEKEIYIVDDDFLIDRSWLLSFIKLLRERKINKHYLVYGRADFIAKNQDVMHELKEIGLRTVIVGFESFTDQELEKYNKKTSVLSYKETMRVLKQEKIECYATIIIPPEWAKKDFDHMVKVVRSLGLHFVNLQPLTPLPKTPFTYPESEIIIPRSEYEKWDLAHITVQPHHMSVSEFYHEILKAYNRILYSPGTIWKYITSYPPLMLYKMLKGGYKVGKQYRNKIKEAKKYA